MSGCRPPRARPRARTARPGASTTGVVPVDDVQVLGLVELAGRRVGGLEDLGVLVVDHGLGTSISLVEERDHVEVLDDLLVLRSRVAAVSSPGSGRSRRPAVTSNSLPKPQAPTFLPSSLQGSSSPVSFQVTDSVPERWKIWAMSTRSEPASRASRTLGTQEIVNSGPSGAEPTCCGTTVGPPSSIVDREPLGRVVALLVGREVAGELGLRRPLELQLHDAGPAVGARGLGRRLRAGAADAAVAWAPTTGRAGSGGRARARTRGDKDRRGRESEDARVFVHGLLCCARVSAGETPLSSAAAHGRGSSERYRLRGLRGTSGSRPGRLRVGRLSPRRARSCATGSRCARRARSAGRTRCPPPAARVMHAQVMSKRRALMLVITSWPEDGRLAAEVLGDDRADQAQGRRELEGGEQVRQRVGDAHLAQDGALVAA